MLNIQNKANQFTLINTFTKDLFFNILHQTEKVLHKVD